jgi:hypothetical protein
MEMTYPAFIVNFIPCTVFSSHVPSLYFISSVKTSANRCIGPLLTPETTVVNSSAESWQSAGFGRFKEEGDEHSPKRRSPASTKHRYAHWLDVLQ